MEQKCVQNKASKNMGYATNYIIYVIIYIIHFWIIYSLYLNYNILLIILLIFIHQGWQLSVVYKIKAKND